MPIEQPQQFTQEDLDYMQQHGIDPSTFKVMNDQEVMDYQTQQKGRIRGAILPSLRQNAGRILGGGGAATAMWGAGEGLAALAAPESFGASLLVPPLLAAVGSYIGSKAGDTLQHKVVEPVLGETPERQQEVEQQAESGQRVFPNTTMGTDIVAGALAGGGSPSYKPAMFAAKGLVEGLKREGLSLAALKGSGSIVQNQAIQNVITGGALNTAINAGTQLATTGTIDPKELLAGAAAGVAFAQPSFIAKRLNPNWKPLSQPQAERPTVAENIDPSGENFAKVQANKDLAWSTTDAMQNQVNEDMTSHQQWAAQQEQAHEQMYAGLEEQQNIQRHQAEQAENWIKTDDKGSYLVGDKLIKSEYLRRAKGNPKDATTSAEAAMIRANNQRLEKVPLSEMRQAIYDQDLQQYNPEKFQQIQEAKAQQDQAQLVQMRALNEQLAQMAAKKTEAPPKVEPEPIYEPSTQEELQAQINDELGQKPKVSRKAVVEVKSPQLSPEDQALVNNGQHGGITHKTGMLLETLGYGHDAILKMSEEQGQNIINAYNNGNSKFQQGEGSPEGYQPTTELLKEAGKASTGVGMVQGDLVTPSGNKALGVKYAPENVGRRLIGLAKNAGNDTGYHELTHQMISDLESSGDPNHQAIANAVKKAFGSEEQAAESIGKRYQQRAEIKRNAFEKLKDYLSDVMVATRTKGGRQGSAEDLGQNLVARMETRHGADSVTNDRTTYGRYNRFKNQVEKPNTFQDSIDDYRPALKLADGTIMRGEKGDDHGPVFERAFEQGRRLSGSEPGFVNDTSGEFVNRDEMRAKHGVNSSTDVASRQDKFQSEPTKPEEIAKEIGYDYRPSEQIGGLRVDPEALSRMSPEDQSRMRQLMDRFPKHWEFTNPENGRTFYVPEGSSRELIHQRANEAYDDTLGNKYQEVRFKPTEAALDAVDSIPQKEGKIVRNGLQKTITERQNLMGRLWNPNVVAARNTTKTQQNKVRDVMLREVNDKASYRGDLTTPEEQHLYDTLRSKLLEAGQYRQQIGEPIYRNGVPTQAKIDPYYYPTTVDPKVSQLFRQNTDQSAIQKYKDDFIAQQQKHGFGRVEAESNLKEMINSFQGSAQRGHDSHQNFFNANRKAQGIPLPESWQRQDLMRNLEAYFRRSTIDMSYYNNVEKDHDIMAALGYHNDPWKNDIVRPNIENIYGNSAVDAVMQQIRGEHAGYSERTQHAGEALATTAMLGPLTEIHKAFSSVAQTVTYSSNPLEAAKTIVHAIQNIGDAWTRVLETGYVQLDAAKARDMIESNVAGFERLRGLSKAVRNVYSLGGLTEHVTKSFLHGAGEYLIPAKVEMANNPKASPQRDSAQRLLKHLDPDYVVGTTYKGPELTRMASEFANLIHGSKDARTLPAWMLKDNEVSAFFKLSSWNIAQTNNFFRNVVTPLKNNGDVGPLLMTTLGVTLGGAVIKELRELLSSKKSPIPSLTELANSSRGLAGNKSGVAYNWMAMASYAGFAGILSTVAKIPFDYAFKNTPGGATFPLDEVATNVANTARNVAEALMNDPDADLVKVGTQALFDLAKQNIQFMRIGINQMSQNGMLADTSDTMKREAYNKQLTDKLGELRRYKMAEGLPYERQEESTGNPYMFMGEKEFKREGEPMEAFKQVRPLVTNIIKQWANNPEVLMQRLRSLKQTDYETMPSLNNTPLAFARYVRFLNNTKGPEAAREHVMDYLHREALNQAKGSMVP